MKMLKNILVLFVLAFLFPLVVNAGSIEFHSPEKLSETKYRFTMTVDHIRLNYISGRLQITNGTITKITTNSGWINKTGTNNQFYFYRDGAASGNIDYIVATFEVTMTGNSEYSVQELFYGVNTCKKDDYGNFFGVDGKLVTESVYNSTCLVSHDATLKSLTTSSGELSPYFKPSLELYSITVPNSVNVLTFYPTLNHSKAKVLSGTTCSLNVGINLCKLTVQAEAGDTKTYTITVVRKNSSSTTLSSEAGITDLKVHNGTLTTPFSPSVKEYHVKVDKNASQIYFTFRANSNNQMHTSQPCNVSSGTVSCKLTIIADDEVTTNTYTFYIDQDQNNSSSNNNSGSGTNSNKPSNNSSGNINGGFNANHGNSNSENQNPIIDENNSNDAPITSVIEDQNATENNNNGNNQDNVNDGVSDNQENSNEKKDEEYVTIPIIHKEISWYTIKLLGALILGVIVGLVVTKISKRKRR